MISIKTFTWPLSHTETLINFKMFILKKANKESNAKKHKLKYIHGKRYVNTILIFTPHSKVSER